MKIFFLLLFFVFIIAIEFLATTTVQIEVVESMWDKSNHFIAFFTLYILMSLSFHRLSVLQKVLWLMLFAIQIEVVQYFIEGRYFSLLDIVSDSIGILIGVLVFKITKRYF